MHRLNVKPPEGDFVDTYLLSRNIAHAAVPLAADPHATIVEGLLDSKVADIKVQDAAMQTVAPLNVIDRRLLREILPDLPALTITSDAEAKANFRNQWERHPKAPKWRPYLPTEQDQVSARSQAVDISSRHLAQMQEWLHREMLKAFDRYRTPAIKVGLGVYISREDAHRYLKEHSMDVAEPAPNTSDEPPASGARTNAENCKITRHSSETQLEDTVDTLINALIAQSIERLPVGTGDATILKQVIAMFCKRSETDEVLDLRSYRGHGGNFEIHRKNDSPLTYNAIRVRIRRARAKTRHPNTE